MTGSHSMLGYYCNQHTSHSSKWGISHSLSIELALICSTLVDAPKQGMSLTPYHYNRIRAYHNRYKSPPPQCEHRHGNLKRSLDDFVARKIEIMENDFSAQLKNTAAADTELTQGWKDVERSSVGDQPLKKCLDRLKTRLDKVQQMWCRRNGESAHRRENQRLKPGDLCRYETPRGDDDEGSSFTDIVEEAYSAYVAISPLPDGETESDHPVVKCWAMEAVKGNPDSPWALLKASCAFLRYRSSSFVWYMCGRQLCIIKAKAQPGGPRYICEEIYMSLKTPKKHVDARRLMRQGGGMRG